ncbi:Oxidoreductase protein, putative [Shewanella piezotolerans WP3]|uniref:Oxidoreductase protein, putative n=1 Tax=Shewanella piezotolerans (strain WP3 / JCM 13877) TaxID=225849 RepID=B8CK81_SHEPW|nr:Oxidoreductase protein, putative [Shewanella piezotolerans WP3]
MPYFKAAKLSLSDQIFILIGIITGASGGVGSAAVQLAKARGAFVIAITSKEKQQQLLSVGADQVINRSDELLTVLASNTIDVVIDLVAGKQWPQLLELLRPGGRYAVAGAIGGAMVNLDVRTLYLKDLSLFGCTVLHAGVFQALVRHIEQGKVKPLIAEVYALKDIPAAQRSFAQKQHVGKIVIDISQQ